LIALLDKTQHSISTLTLFTSIFTSIFTVITGIYPIFPFFIPQFLITHITTEFIVRISKNKLSYISWCWHRWDNNLIFTSHNRSVFFFNTIICFLFFYLLLLLLLLFP